MNLFTLYIYAGSMKPVFCGNFEYDAREGDLERLFRKYGKVERVDMKAGEPFFILLLYLFCLPR